MQSGAAPIECLVPVSDGANITGSASKTLNILHAFSRANLGQYLLILLFRSPALLAAVVVYSEALSLFGVEISYLQMLGILPVIFFGASIPGPFRAVAVSMWVILFPEYPAEMSAFGLVQHNFFILFNAVIGLVFLRRAQKELFE